MTKLYKTMLFHLLAMFFVLFSVPALSEDEQVVKIFPQSQEIDQTSAIGMLLFEAEKGNAKAMLSIGGLFEHGFGDALTRHFGKALEWYRKAAEAGLPEGFYNVGVCYEIGIGTVPDLNEALANFKKASEIGMSQADFKLFLLYEYEQEIPKDHETAMKYLNKAVDQNHSVALNVLGVAYNKATLGLEKDDKKAWNLFLKASEAGLPEAMKNLAILFQNGEGQPQSNLKALKWFILSDSLGYNHEELINVINQLKSRMEANEIEKAEQEAKDWLKDKLVQNKDNQN